jgi:uncharacterized membrane protein YcjF (UPF0283 family)
MTDNLKKVLTANKTRSQWLQSNWYRASVVGLLCVIVVMLIVVNSNVKLQGEYTRYQLRDVWMNINDTNKILEKIRSNR